MTIQEAGKQILTNQPTKFYIFCGEEYGIKFRYIEQLKQHYGSISEVNTVDEVISLMRKKRLFPLQPKVYVIRYDDTFISSINDKTADLIASTNIVGTIVCIYEQTKHRTKCNKYLPDYTVTFDPVNPTFIKQYLESDFPNLPTTCIDMAIKLRGDYMGAYHICESMTYAGMYVDDTVAMVKAFSSTVATEDNAFRYAFAAKDFNLSLHIIDEYTGELSAMFYTMLMALIELERISCTPKCKSDLGRYAKLWSANSIYWAFMHVYNELRQSRSGVSYNVYDRLIYLLSIMQYQEIPALGVI